MSLLVLTSSDVDHITSSFTSSDLQNLMSDVFVALSRSPSQVDSPHRTNIATPNHTSLFMPARISSTGTAMKVVSVPKAPGDTGGLPASTLVMDEDSGRLKAVVNARALTALRNAAGSLLSTTLVGPLNPSHIVAFGAGKQIQAHLSLFTKHFPSIRTCTVVNRTINPRLEALLRDLQNLQPGVTFQALGSTQTPDEVRVALADASIVICATPSQAPLFSSSWIRAGTHVILIGSYTPSMHEVDSVLIRRALSPTTGANSTYKPILLVDSRSACLAEAGELIAASVSPKDLVEIGEIVHGDGRPRFIDISLAAPADFSGPIALFKSVGVGVQDVAIACAVVRRAEEMGSVGVLIPDYD